MPPEGATENTNLPTPFQSLGARAVNNLASKIILTLFPPNEPFFRLAADESLLVDASDADVASFEAVLGKIERAVMQEIEVQAIRVAAFEAAKLLITTGNCLLYLPDDGGMKVYKLPQYVVQRDPMGNETEMILREEISPEALPDDIRETVVAAASKGSTEVLTKVELFTQVKLDDGKWQVRQEAGGVMIPSSEGSYKKADSPWLPQRWTAIEGENYGRGLVEEYLGDLRSLEGLNASILDAAAAASKIVFLVSPNGVTKTKDLNAAESGDAVVGLEQDVHVLQIDKSADFRVAYDQAQNIEQRLSQAFLLMSSIQRQAERVTAEEIRLMAGELEDTLGGVYSVLSQTMQRPLVNRLLQQMSSQQKIPTLPKGKIQPLIVTGLEALGRGHEADKLKTLLGDLVGLFTPQVVAQYLSPSAVAQRLGTAYGVSVTDLVKSDEQVAQESQSQQVSGALGAATPGVARELVKGAIDSGQTAAQAPAAPGQA